MNIVQKIKQHWLLSGAVVVVIIGSVWWYRSTHAALGPVQYATATVGRQTIVSTVSGSGQVSSKNQIDLKPQGSGIIRTVNVVAGQQVKAGTVVATLDQRSASVAIQQAKASLESAQISYNRAASGLDSTDPDVISAQQTLTSAQASLENAKNNLEQVKKQQDLAVANSLRAMLNTGVAAVQVLAPYTSVNVTVNDVPTITGGYSSTDTGTYTIVQQGGYFYVQGLENMPMTKFDKMIPTALGTRGLFIQFPNDLISVTWKVDLPNKAATGYLASNNSYQSALQSQQSAISSAQNQVDSATLSVTQAQTALQQKLSPGSSGTIASARASLESARAQLLNAQNNYMNNVVVAPFDGVIAKVNVIVGDDSATAAVATLITKQKIVTLTLNEIDISKIKMGEQAVLTFDAVSGLSITGKVSEIDALGTVSQGVVNYSVQIALDTDDDRVKPGMSAHASIITDTKTDVVAVPSGAVKTAGGNATVQVVTANQIISRDTTSGYVTLSGAPTSVPVTVGSTNGTYTEIVSGLSEGDMVITQTIDPAKAKTTAAASSASSLRIPGITSGGTGTRTGGNAVFINR